MSDPHAGIPANIQGSRLAGAVSIITGGGSEGDFFGTGAAMSMLFAAQGSKIAIVDHSTTRATNTLRHIETAGGQGIVIEADITDTDDCAAAVDTTVKEFGRLDALVNNAAITVFGSVTDIALDDWERGIAVNLGGAMRMSRAAIPAMKTSGGGSIINISSIVGVRGHGSAAYASSKAGLLGLTTDMAHSYGPDGIRVNTILPGYLRTPMGASMPEDLTRLGEETSMLQSTGTAWDVAWAALFLASAESRWITATHLPVDAGAIATTAFGLRLRDL